MTVGAMPVWLRGVLFLSVTTGCVLMVVAALWKGPPQDVGPVPHVDPGIAAVAAEVDAEFAAAWVRTGEEPAGRADGLTVMRRIGLGMMGTIPSFEEIRLVRRVPEDRRIEWWLERVFQDARFSDYVAERLARVYVGTEAGPFLVFRRRLFVDWLAGQLHENRPYDELARELIAATGTSTNRPASNFVTRTVLQDQGPEEARLASRLTRAFLGIRLDCVECHDDFLEAKWKQTDFHRLAAFFQEANLTLTGVADTGKVVYEARMRGRAEPEAVPAGVPFGEEWLPGEGRHRERLAGWVTHQENEAFARTAVNRVWALLFGRPLVAPIDRIPLEGEQPPGLDRLARDFVENGHDLRRLVQIIVASDVFRRESLAATGEPEPGADLVGWTSFPLTPLRPEQVARSIDQASSLATINRASHVVLRIRRFGETRDFVKRYGDSGEDEFSPATGTVPQRLLLMNGKLVREHTQDNLIMNAATRIGALAKDEPAAVEAAYLAVLTRPPTTPERAHFVSLLRAGEGKSRAEPMEDLYWSLINATEFSWNH